MVEKLNVGYTQMVISKIKVSDRYRENKGAIEEMVGSLKRIGLINPITLDEDGNLLAGERRLLGAIQLGWKSIPARVVKKGTDPLEVELDENVIRKDFEWPERARLEKAIYDRQKKSGKWTLEDQEELRQTPKTTLYRRIQLADAMELIPELQECETQDDAWKAFKKLEEEAAVQHMRTHTPEHIKEAPKWAEEHYRVGDAMEGLARTEDEVVDFAECDPPYGIDFDERKGRNKDKEKTDDYNEIPIDEYREFYKLLALQVYRILKPNAFAVFWYGWQWHQDVLEVLEDAGFKVNPIPAIWYKGQAGQTNQPDIMLASSQEPFFLARKGSPRLARSGRSNVFHFSPVAPSKKIHLTEKPLELLQDILGTVLFPGSTVLVPFLGSGVTLRAAYNLGHTGFGWDLNQKHKDRFLRLVAGETDEKDVLHDDGKTVGDADGAEQSGISDSKVEASSDADQAGAV